MKALRIVVVEDDAMIGLFLGMTLEQMGHQVCATVATEDAAVKAAADFAPDLMIVDARLREGDGISAVERILSTGPMPHLFCSGDLNDVKARLPDSDVLQKPFCDDDLSAAILRVLDIGADSAERQGRVSLP
jgi:DNA-binding response OmpR family regulator